MKAGKILALLTILVLSTSNLFAQSYLIPIDAAANKYPITFTDAAQQTLVLEFDRAVTAAGTSAGWTITVGGVAVPMSGSPVMLGNYLRITLSVPIPYANRTTVLVTYNAAVGTMSLTGPVEPSFTNIQAVNNYIGTQSDFSNGLYGENPPVDICAPVQSVEITSNIVVSQRFRNSIHFKIPRMYTLWMFPATSPKTDPNYIEVGGVGTGIYSATQNYAAYPDNTTNCTWVISVYPFVLGSAPQPILNVTNNQVFITIPNYKKDNGTPVPGTGDLGLNPPVDDPATLFCVGENITAFTFTDATVFDCQLPVEPNLPNTRTRYVQYVYGTHTAPGIPNVYIDVNGTMVQVTDNNGVAISGTWHVNPDGTPNGPGYTTASGFFEGPVTQYTWDPATKTLLTPMATTYPIYHTGNYITDAENDIFDVTLRNWGPCNPYDALDPLISLQAVTEFSRLRLVGAPPLPTAPDVTVCTGSSTVLTAVRNGTNPGILHWYNNSDLLPIHEVGTGTTYNPGAVAAGTYNYWVREIGTTGMLCEGPAEQVVLTVVTRPNKPTITYTGSLEFCYDGTTSLVLQANVVTPPAVASYQWYKNGVAVGGATSSTLTLNMSGQTGTYTVAAVGLAPTSCLSTVSDPVNVIIHALSNLTNPSPVTVCQNSTATFSASTTDLVQNWQWEVSTNGGASYSTVGNGPPYSGFNSNTLTINPASLSMNGYYYRVEIKTPPGQGGCTFKSAGAMLTVNPNAVITLTSAAGTNIQSPCISTAITPITYSVTGGGTGAGVAGLPPGVTGSFSGGVYTISGTPTSSGTYNYTVTTTGSCTQATATGTITVRPNNTITRTSAASTENQTLCINTAITTIRYTTTGATGATFSNLPPGVTGVWSANVITINGSPTSSGTYNFTITLTGGCGTVTRNARITVTPANTITLTSAVGTDSQTKCINTAITNITYSTTGATGATVTGLPTGVTGSWAANVVTITGTPTASGSFTYTITLTGGCGTVTRTGTITVNPVNTITRTSAAGTDNQNVCINTAITNITYSTTGATGATFAGLPAGVTGSWASDAITISGTPSVNGTFNYTITLTGGCGTVTRTGTIRSNPNNTITRTSAAATEAQTVCINNPITNITYTTTGATGATFANLPAGVNGTWAANAITISGTPTVDGTFNYTITLTGGCGNITRSATITVNPAATVNAGPNQSICALGTVTLAGSVGGSASSGTWTGGTGTYNPGSTTLNAIYTPSAAERAANTVTLTLTTNDPAGPCPAVSDQVTISIGTPLTAATLTGSGDACVGATSSITSVLTGGAPPYTINYTRNGVAQAAITPYTSGAPFSLGVLPVGTYIYQITSVTDPCGNSVPMGGLPPAYTIHINPIPDITGTTPASQSVCSDGTASINLSSTVNNTIFAYSATSAPAAGYSWTAGKDPVAGSITDADGNGTETLSRQLQHNYNAAVTVTYTITPTGPGATACPGTAITRTVIVNPVPAVTNMTATICSGTAFTSTPVNTTNGVVPAGTTYTWAAPVIAPAGAITGGSAQATGQASISQTLTNTTNTAATATYTVTPLSGSCTGATFTVTVTVNPTPSVTAMTATACSATAFTATPVNVTNGIVPAGTTYTWTAPVIAPAGAITGGSAQATGQASISQTLTNTTNAAATATYTVTPVSGSCTGATFTVTVTVNPRATIAAKTTTICSTGTFTVTPVNGGAEIVPAGTTYTWTAPVIAPAGAITGGSAQATGQASISQALTNTTNASATATYTVTPTSGTCTGPTFTVTVTVSPRATIAAKTTTICSTGTFTVTPVNGGAEIVPAGTTYTWTAPVIAPAGAITGGSAQATGQASISQALTNTTNASATATYTVTPTSGSCAGPTFTVTVTVSPRATIAAKTTTICSTGTFTVTPVNGGAEIVPAGTTYTWTAPVIAPAGAITGGSAQATGQASISQALTNTTNASATATYTVTPTSGSCAGPTFTVTVTVSPRATIAAKTTTICSTGTFTVTPVNGGAEIVPAGTTYTWTAPVIAPAGAITGGSAQATGQASISQVLTNTTNASATATYTVTPTSGSCAGPTFTVTVTVSPRATIADKTTTICSTGTFTVTPVNGGAEIVPAGTTYTWTAPVIAPAGAITGGSAQATGQASISQALTNTTNASATATYTVTPTSGSCAGPTFTVTVTVSPRATIANKTTTICNTGTFTVTPVNGGAEIVPAGTTYTWTAPVIAPAGAITGGSAQATGQASISQALTNTTNASATATYTVTPTSGSCAGPTFTVTVTVSPSATIANKTTTICSTGTFTVTPVNGGAEIVPAGTTYTWTAPVIAPAGAITGGSAQATGQASISQALTNTTNASATATYTVTPTSGSCTGPTFTVTVTVSPRATIAAKTTTICSTGTFTVTPVNGGAEIVPAGTTYTWTAPVIAPAGAITGGSAQATGQASISQALTNTTNASATATYTVTPTSGSCAGPTFTVTVTVSPRATIANKTSTICSTGTFTVTPVNGGAEIVPAGTTYTWTAPVIAPAGAITGGSAQATGQASISQALTNTTNASATATYTVTPTSGSCTGPTFTVTVTVSPRATIADKTTTICSTGTFTVTPVNGGAEIVPAGTTYTWTAPVIAPAGAITGGSAQATGQASISQALTNTTNASATATYTVTPTSGSCAGPTFTVTVTVSPRATIANKTTTICSTGTFTVTPVNGGAEIVPAGTTYTWTAPVIAPAGAITGGSAQATGQASISQALTNTTNASATATYTVTPASGSCTGPAFTVTVTVSPAATISAKTTTVCTGTAFSVTPVNGGAEIVPVGTLYTWTAPVIAPAGAITGGSAQAVAQSSVSQTLTNSTTAPATATYTVTPLSGSCTGATFTVTVTVNPAGQVDQPANQTVCNNGSTAAVLFTTVNTVGTTSYSWTNSAAGIGLAASGTGDIPVFTAVNSGTAPVIATIIVTPTFTYNATGCAGSTRTFTITVNPTPVLSTTLTPAAVCSNTPFSYPPASATAGTTFDWDRAAVPGITPAGPTSGTGNPNETLRNLTSAPIAVTYQYTLTANGCTNIQNVVVNINPEPVITAGQNTTTCSGNAISYQVLLNNFVNPAGNVTFTWPAPVLNPADPGFTGGSARVSASTANITDTFINTMGAIGTATYTITPYRNGCAGDPVTVVVNVGSEPVLDPGLDNQACSNTAIGLVLKEAAGSVTPTYYNIISKSVDAGLTDAGNAAVPFATAADTYLSGDRYTNTTGVDKTVTYRVQPILAPNCIGAPVDVVITIRPQPVIMPAQTKTVCSGIAIGKEIVLVPANTPAGTLFSWPVPVLSDASVQGTAAANVAADPAGTIHINDAINNYSGAPITATYTITPVSAFGCAGTPVTAIITINPEPIPQPISGRDKICVNDKNIVYNVSAVSGSTFHWTVDAALGTKTFDFNANAILIDAAAVAGSGNITVYETNSYACNGDVSTLPVQVYSVPAAENITGPAVVCANSTQVYSMTNRPGSTYSWTVPGGTAIIGDPSASSITLVFANVGGTISVREVNAAGCITNHNPFSVTVNPLPTATISGSGTICSGSSRNLSVDFTGTGPWAFTYALDGVPQPPVSTASDPYTLNVTQAGTYTIVNVSDANCTNTGTGTATVNYYPVPTGIISGSTEMCRGTSATLTMTFTGQAPFNFTYTDGVTPVTVTGHATNVYTASVSPLNNTSYTLVSLTDGNSCTGNVSGTAAITVNIPPTLSLSGTNLICYNVNTGAVDLTISGGTAPYGITWTGPGAYTASTEDISGLGAGYYAVTVMDSKGCTVTGNITLTQLPVLAGTATGTNITCFGASDGTITISGSSGGSGTWEYTIDGGATWQASPNYTGLAPGTYNVVLRDAANPTCMLTLNSSLQLTGPAVLSATVSSVDVNCFGAGNGSIVVSSPSGGYGTYGYSVNGGATWQGSGSFTNLAPGSYDVMIRDAVHTACEMALTTVTISQPPVLSATVASTNISCFGTSDGTVTISAAAGGHGTYEYSINGGGSWQASGSFTALAPGTYNIQVRDAAYTGCYIILNNALVITQPAVLAATAAQTNVSCNGANDGIITISGATGGYGTYEYSNDGGANWQASGTFSGLAPASYDVRIRDAAHSACEIIINPGLLITEPALLSGVVVHTDITCFTANDGTITINNSAGGYGTYQYSVNGGGAWQDSPSFAGLTPGSYDVRIRDRAHTGCVITLDPAVIVLEPAVLNATVASTNVTCFNAADGTITISSPTGGWGTYSYSINGGTSWQATGNFTNLAPGTYNIRIRDAAHTGCIIALNPAVVITQPPVLSATAARTNVTCNGAADGTITISAAAGGYGTYEYTINGGSAWQASNVFTGLIPGFYNVKIRDAAHTGCEITINGSLGITEPSALNATVGRTNVTCNGAANGTITITNPVGGYGTYQYSIDGGSSWQASGSFSGLAPATYDVRIRDAAQVACVITLNPALSITEPAVLAATVTATDVSCFGANNGIISITGATGGYGSYEYSINGGTTWSGLGSFTNLIPGTYDVRIRDAAYTSCVITLDGALVITQPAVLSATVARTNLTCFGAGDGTITISAAAGGYGTYEYSINGGGSWQASGSFTGLGPGNYNVRIRDAAHTTCVIVLNNALQITQPAVLNATVTPTNVTCNGAADGIINITSPTGGYGTYEYSVDGGTGWQASGLFNGLAPATYDVRIRDAVNTGCVIVLNNALTITEPAVLNANVSSTNVTCFGANNGTITVSLPTGGYGTYDYSRNGGATWQATGSFTGLAPGTYDVRIRDRAHITCIAILDPALVITEPAVLSATVASTNVTCFGANNGTITISAPLGGYGTYSYSVNGGTSWQSSGIFSNLAPATYNVRIRDAAYPTCEITLNGALVITQPAVLTATVASTNVTCNSANDGTITVSGAAGGYGTYEYTVNGGASWQASGSFTGLTPGFYNVQVRDAANTGCVITLNSSLRITEPNTLSANIASTNVTCNAAANGTITITSPSGGYGTYEYSINGGAGWQASGSFTALAPATYNVQIRDAAHTGCIIVLNPALVITEPAVLNAVVTPTDVTCNGANDGTIIISGSTGGYGSYQYTINGGTTWTGSGSFTGLAPATYNVQMRDAANPACVLVLNAALTITQPAVLAATVVKADVTCFGGSDGSITISSPTGGYGTYEYSINGGGSWQASGSFTSLVPGTYNVRIRDAAHTGCVIILNNSLSITQPPVLNAVVTPTNVTCNGANDGIISITAATGGYGTYQYSIDGGATWSASGLFNGLAPATYNVHIRDAAHIACDIILNGSLTITEPAALSASVSSTNVTCFGANNGTITITLPSGGYGTYEYSRNGGTTWQATGIFTNLIPGSYDVRIRDRAHITCVAVLDPALVISEPAVLSATVASTNVTCFSANNGTISITSPLGGYGTYQYTVNSGATWQGTGTFNGLAPGTYNVRIRDAAYPTCEIVLSAALVITQPAVLSATVASTNVTCFGAADGSITISSPLGGYGTYEYTVNGGAAWQASGSFTGLTPGFYNVQIRDAANTGCVIILNGSLRITEPAVLAAVVSSTNITCNSSNDGTITVFGSTGGYGTYEYSIDGGATWQASGSFSALAPASYNVQVRDAAHTGCIIVLNPALLLTEPAALTATVTPTMVSCFNANNGVLSITTPAGGYGTYQYSINGGTTWSGSGTFSGLSPATYNVQVRDAAHTACVVILDPALVITQPAVLSATISSTNVSCFGGSDGTITISAAAGGYGTYEYSINGGGAWQASGSFTGLSNGSYNVLIRDAAHTSCVIVLNSAYLITQPGLLSATVLKADVTCNGASDGIINITSPSGGYGTYEYSVDGGTTWAAGGLFGGLPPATYNVRIRDAAHTACEVTLNSAVVITEPAIITATVASSNITCFGANNGTISITAPTGGYGTYDYSIDGAVTWQASGSFSGLIPATYNVQIRDRAHPSCIIILNPALVITEPAALSATVAFTNVTCFSANNGTISITSPLGGYGTYQYSINGGASWQGSGSFTGLAPGTYNVRIRDAVNTACELVLNAALVITQPPVLSATVASTNVTCYGAADGTITLTSPLGGYGTYEYSISGGAAWQASGSFTALSPGFYNVQIRDAANPACVIILNGSLRITEPPVLAAFISSTNISCNGSTDGTITVLGATGGYGTYEYSVNGGGTWQASGSFSGLAAASYNVQIRDAAHTGCIIVLDPALVLTQPAVLSATVTPTMVSCYNANNGIITVSAPSGGYGSYQYSINGGTTWQGSGTFSNLAPASYNVQIRDAAHTGCVITLDPALVITQPAILNASVTSTNVSCFGGNDGTITIAGATGGYGTYEYSINGGGSWQASGSFTGLTTGSYNILIRDAAHTGCVIVLNNAYLVTQPALLSATVAKTDVSCSGDNNGTITVSAATGGYGTYEYTIDGGSSWQASGSFTGLIPGTYDVRIRDAAHPACSVMLYPNLVITEPITLALTSTGNVALNCFGDLTGAGTFYAAGGTLPFTFTVLANTAGATIAFPGFNSQTFFGAGAGTVTVQVTDHNGCFAVASIDLTQPGLLTPGTIGSDQVLCSGSNPAQLTETAAATGGPAPYIYQWQYGSTAAGPFINIAGANSFQYTPAAAATATLYYRRMVSSGSCTPVYSNVVEVRVNPNPVALLTGGETICPAQSSVLNVTMMMGTAPFELDIENLGTVTGYISGADITVTPAATTTYRLLRVRDANGCEVLSPSANLMGSATVIVRALPAITVQPVNKTSCEFGMVTMGVTATGTDLSYQWYVNQGSGFNPVADGGIYFGATAPTLNLFGVTRDMNGYVYHAVVTGCSTDVTSTDATLTVNTAPEIVTQPKDSTICQGTGATFSVSASGTTLAYQWQVNRGAGFVNVVNDANFSGASLNTLTIVNAPGTFNNYIFRVVISGVCGVPVYSNFVVLRVNNPPLVTLQPVSRAVCDGTGPVLFTANGSGLVDSVRWEVFSGGSWTDVHDDAIYSGATSQQLMLSAAPFSLNGNQYRLSIKARCTVVNTNAATLTVYANPVVDFSAVDPIHACGGVPISINGNPTGGSGTWTTHMWTGDVGPLNNYYIQSPTFNASIAGTYLLNYQVRDNRGCTANDDVTVIVDSPDATFTWDTNNGCTPATISFSKDMTGLSKFWWDFNDGSPIDSVNANPSHQFVNTSASAIEYRNVKLTVRSAGGCLATSTAMMTIYPSVDATFTASPDSVCSGSYVTLTAITGASKYFWDYGDGVSGYATAGTTHLYTNVTAAPVTRTVILTTTSFYNCTDTKTLDVVVMPVPAPQFSADPPTQVYNAAGNNVIFTNETGAGTWNWLWNFGDGSSAAVRDPIHNYTDVGTYNVTLTASNETCTASITHQVMVTHLPPVADFDTLFSGCEPLNITINNTSLNTEIPGTTFRWDFGDGSTSTAKNPTYTYFDAGDYRVELTVTGPGGTSVKSQIVHCYPAPKAYFEVTPVKVFANDERVRMFNLTEGANYYLWDFGDGDTSKVFEPYHRYMEEGVYDITLWAYSTNGCSDRFLLSPGVTVEPAGDIRFSTVFRPNQTAEIDIDHLPTGGDEIDQFFFPPIREKVIKYKLQIFNRLGVLIFESRDINKPWNGYYQHKPCPQGVYVWYVEGKYANGSPFKKVGDVTLLH